MKAEGCLGDQKQRARTRITEERRGRLFKCGDGKKALIKDTIENKPQADREYLEHQGVKGIQASSEWKGMTRVNGPALIEQSSIEGAKDRRGLL